MVEYKIGMVSDTHTEPTPKVLLDALRDCNLIVYLGDCGKDDLNTLSTIAPIVIVGGNSDYDNLAAYPKYALLRIFNWRILATHIIFGGDYRCVREEEIPLELFEEFVTIFFPSCEVVLFGHTHGRFLKRGKRMLFVNSGAIYKPCDKPSVAKLFITPNNIDVKFYLDETYNGPILERKIP
jgi:putative phosphoesterase